jgi:adenylate cyclase
LAVKKSLIFLLIGLISGLAVFFAYRQSSPYLQHLDNRLKDSRFILRGSVTPTPKVVVIAIDDKSIRELGQWPWSRVRIGELVKNLADYGVKVSALDIVFSEPEARGGDPLFARSLESAGNVVMGYFFRDEEQLLDPEALEQLSSSKVKLLKINSDVTSVPITEYKSLTLNIPLLGSKARDFGFFNQIPDSDGVFRKSPLLLLFNGEIYPSLALKALRHSYASEVMLNVAVFGVNSLSMGKHLLPVNEHGELALNYYGPTGSFRTIPAVDVIKKRIKPGELKDCIAFVGATEIGIYDVRNTPFDPALPGVEIHATVAANSIDNRFIVRDGRTAAIEIVAILLLPAILAFLLSLVPGTLAGLGIFASITALFISGNYILFSKYLVDVTIFYPLLSVALSQVTSEAYRNLIVERKGRSLKKAFSSYVSPDLVKQIEKDPDKLVLGGEQREITILFSDIRGFTSISEGLTPQELVRLLNEYLSPMTRIVLQERGTLDKFIGDAVMAIFNAPLDLQGHPEAACRAAVRMLESLRELNAGFSAKNMNVIDIGIGINTGLAVVGNMGADIRFDYTAIGDSVNLASRLESLNKYYGTHILVSEDTRKGVVSDSFNFREVDLVRVKGKQLPVVIYELIAGDAAIIGKFQEGLNLYRIADFQSAALIFSELVEKYSDGPSRLYLERCGDYLSNPPPPDWDGVYTAKSK